MNDKRSVTTDALTTLGTIIDDQQKRDAIHLAVEPVIAGEFMAAGDHIDIRDGVARLAGAYGKAMGIVDPFLKVDVEKGQRFWFVMYPRQVSTLRHVWSHPDFPDEPGTPGPVKSAARLRIEAIAAAMGGDCGNYDEHAYGSTDWEHRPLTYERLMEAAKEWLDNGEYHVQMGSDSWRDDFRGYANEFWSLYATVTGEDVPEDKRTSFFSCSC